MTLDEAIKHAREVAEENREEAMNAFFPPYADECESCAIEHEQLAEWLEELKVFRENFKELFIYDHELAEMLIYCKAIDDLTEKAMKKFTELDMKDRCPTVSDCKSILSDVAESLKKECAE